MGERVLTNEKEGRIVTGFGVVPQTSMMSLDKRRAGLDALAAIQRFVSEEIVADRQGQDGFENRQFASDDSVGFDNGAFEKISLVSKDLKLSGATEGPSWRGEHPWSNAKMQVVAFAWSPSWAAETNQ